MNTFITNSTQKTLQSRIKTLVQSSVELKFLVSFFYFSGLPELYEGIRGNDAVTLRILVGLSIDIRNHKLLELADSSASSDNAAVNAFCADIVRSLCNKEHDNATFHKQVPFFIDMLRTGRLIIRKTHEPNHSKLYLFQLDNTQVHNNLFITGSSNLTRAGLSTQHEFNVEIGDYGYAEAHEYFEALWRDAVQITEEDSTKDKIITVIKEDTPLREVTPFAAYCLMLKSYLDSFETKDIGTVVIEKLKKAGYKEYTYQLDAIKMALATIEKYNGVIIADVVGLGKTVIACAVAMQLRKRGLIICPPNLAGDQNQKFGWARYAQQFDLHDWQVRSSGKLEEALEWLKTKAHDVEVVIVDEAHRFRNEDTRRYELLQNICRNKKVILLTATPFNNKPSDILALLKLFTTPKKSPITLESNIAQEFASYSQIFVRLNRIKKYHDSKKPQERARAEAEYKKLCGALPIDMKKVSACAHDLAQKIRSVIEPVTIRRNRLDLLTHPEYKHEVAELSTVADPQQWFFELNAQQLAFYTRVIGEYFAAPDDGGRFKGAIYKPFEYQKNTVTQDVLDAEYGAAESALDREENRRYQQERNLFDFMRRLLVKRFESSFGAFKKSIANFTQTTKACLQFIQQKKCYILDRDLIAKILECEDEEAEEALREYEDEIKRGEYPKHHKKYIPHKFARAKEFIADIKADIALFDKIMQELADLQLVEEDPKRERVVQKIHAVLNAPPHADEPGTRKVIIFSEYADTVYHLGAYLQHAFKQRVLVVEGTIGNALLEDIDSNFDASHNKQQDRYDILLATDKISEGFNLNRAGMVINYDIPWNPVRVIQRLGRINRISAKLFKELHIVNFFPSEQGAEVVRAKAIAEEKMFIIHNTLGEDTKIFDAAETPTPSKLYERINENPDTKEQESTYTRMLNIYKELQKEHPDIIDKLSTYPPRIKVAKGYTESNMIVFFKKKRLHVRMTQTNGDATVQNLYFEEVHDAIKCTPNTPALPWNTERFWNTYNAIQCTTPYHHAVKNNQSIESKALQTLNYLLLQQHTVPQLAPYQSFLRLLKEDIVYYGTLSQFTLRRIADLIPSRNPDDAAATAHATATPKKDVLAKDTITDIENIQEQLGPQYLQQTKENATDIATEIIIAMENIAQ